MSSVDEADLKASQSQPVEPSEATRSKSSKRKRQPVPVGELEALMKELEDKAKLVTSRGLFPSAADFDEASFRRGEYDTLIITPWHGLIVVETKATRDRASSSSSSSSSVQHHDRFPQGSGAAAKDIQQRTETSSGQGAEEEAETSPRKVMEASGDSTEEEKGTLLIREIETSRAGLQRRAQAFRGGRQDEMERWSGEGAQEEMAESSVSEAEGRMQTLLAKDDRGNTDPPQPGPTGKSPAACLQKTQDRQPGPTGKSPAACLQKTQDPQPGPTGKSPAACLQKTQDPQAATATDGTAAEGSFEAELRQTLVKAIKQLKQAGLVLQYLLSDLPQPPRVTKVLALPYVARARLRDVLQASPRTAQVGCSAVLQSGAVRRW